MLTLASLEPLSLFTRLSFLLNTFLNTLNNVDLSFPSLPLPLFLPQAIPLHLLRNFIVRTELLTSRLFLLRFKLPTTKRLLLRRLSTCSSSLSFTKITFVSRNIVKLKKKQTNAQTNGIPGSLLRVLSLLDVYNRKLVLDGSAKESVCRLAVRFWIFRSLFCVVRFFIAHNRHLLSVSYSVSSSLLCSPTRLYESAQRREAIHRLPIHRASSSQRSLRSLEFCDGYQGSLTSRLL